MSSMDSESNSERQDIIFAYSFLMTGWLNVKLTANMEVTKWRQTDSGKMHVTQKTVLIIFLIIE